MDLVVLHRTAAVRALPGLREQYSGVTVRTRPVRSRQHRSLVPSGKV
ncbi:hypothetical protein [Streptomyces sp. NPDC001137]